MAFKQTTHHYQFFDMYTIYSDGACSGNPGPGGYAALVISPDGTEQECVGGEPQTTNNRMEMRAVIEALRLLNAGEAVHLVTDSKYVLDGYQKWLPGWKRKGWRTAAGQSVKNVDLWRQLEEAMAGRQASWEWVHGHTGHLQNERVDKLARDESLAQRHAISHLKLVAE